MHTKTHLLRLALATGLALLAGCVVAPYPTAYPTTASTPPSFDRSWDAALGAAADAGIQISRAWAGDAAAQYGGATTTYCGPCGWYQVEPHCCSRSTASRSARRAGGP